MWIFQHAAVLLLVAGCLAYMCRPGPVSHDPAQSGDLLPRRFPAPVSKTNTAFNASWPSLSARMP